MLSTLCFVLLLIPVHLVSAHMRLGAVSSTKIDRPTTVKNVRKMDGSGVFVGEGDDVDDKRYRLNDKASEEEASSGVDKAADFIIAEKEYMTRALHSGDTFTPLEMLPVAFKLLSKMDVIGEGRGIVSAAKSPEDLADKLFGAYFLTRKRIVYLNDQDISGLDALQALALEGDAIRSRTSKGAVTTRPIQVVNYRGQEIGVENGPKTCHYKLLNKKEELTAWEKNLRRGERISKLEKKMRPNRHVIVNAAGKGKNGKLGSVARQPAGTAVKQKIPPQKGLPKKARRNGIRIMNRRLRRNGALQNKNDTSLPRNNADLQSNQGDQNETTYQLTTTVKRKSNCKWRYNCKDPADLDSCRLHTSCLDENNPNAKEDDIFVEHREDEHNESVKQFRKMMGITLLDEDVEKILEKHILKVRPENLRGLEKIETLEEYFNNIIMAQHARSTTPSSSDDTYSDTNIESDGQPHHPLKDHALQQEELRASQKNKNGSIPDARKQILSLPKMTTTKSRRK